MSDERPFWEGDLWKREMAPRLELPEADPPEVYPHLLAGLDQARDDVLSVLNGFAYSFVTEFGRLAVEWKTPMHVGPGQAELFDWPLLEDAWFKRGAELVLAEVSLERAAMGFERLHDLKPVASSALPNQGAIRYLREVSQLFLLGFDGPCLAFCGAALEQVLKDALVRKGVLSEADLTNRKMGGADIVIEAKNAGLVATSADNATRVFHERNRAMHRHLWDDRIIRQMAAISVADLLAVLRELAVTAPEV